MILSLAGSGKSYWLSIIMPQHHRSYRNFWIRDTYKNRQAVDRFYAELEALPDRPASSGFSKSKDPTFFDSCTDSQLDEIEAQLAESNDTTSLFAKQFKKYVVKAIQVGLDSDGSTLEARIRRAGESMRLSSQFHKTIMRWAEWNKFRKVLIKKTIEMMNEGLVEAYLTFKIYHPEMVTREIQPYFNFKGNAYSDDRWVEVVTNDFWKPYVKDVYFMSGFNRFWRTDIGEYLGEYQWSYFLESSLKDWLAHELPVDMNIPIGSWSGGGGGGVLCDWSTVGQNYCQFAKKYNFNACHRTPWTRVMLPDHDSSEEYHFRDTVRNYLIDSWCASGAPFKQKDREWMEEEVDCVMNYITDLCNGKVGLDITDLNAGHFYGINYKLNSGGKKTYVLRLVKIEYTADWKTMIVGYVVGDNLPGITRFDFEDIETIYEAC